MPRECGFAFAGPTLIQNTTLEFGVTPGTIADLADALYREEVSRARAMSPEDKLLEGPRLFERVCQVMRDGIRHRHPDLNDAGIAALLRERLDLARTLERQ